MVFRPQPESFYWSDRIDYDAVSARMLELRTRCEEAADLAAFIAVIRPVFQRIVADHLHLVIDRTRYREGEMATLLAHLGDCVNAIMPAHLPYVALSEDKLRFIPKSHIIRDES